MKPTKQKKIFTLVLEYKDESDTQAEIVVDGEPHEYMALLLMICRGTLMASGAKRSIIYNSEGFEECAYIK